MRSILWPPVAVGVSVQSIKGFHTRNTILLGGTGHHAFHAPLRIKGVATPLKPLALFGLSEADSPSWPAFEVASHVFGCVQVSSRWVAEVAPQQAGHCGNVRASAPSQPVEAPQVKSDLACV